MPLVLALPPQLPVDAQGACGGPEPLPNGEIDPLGSYWYVELKPAPVTPSGPSMSPTAPPLIPEPCS